MSDEINSQTTEDERAVRVNITLPPDVDELLTLRARTERRSKSAHVAWLIERDAKPAVVVSMAEAACTGA